MEAAGQVSPWRKQEGVAYRLRPSTGVSRRLQRLGGGTDDTPDRPDQTRLLSFATSGDTRLMPDRTRARRQPQRTPPASKASANKPIATGDSSHKRRGPSRYAVIGLGYIAQSAVLPAFAHARSNSALAALVSSDAKKLRALGKRYGVSTLVSYDDCEELLASGEIDAVYIALPNTMHREYTAMAARHGAPTVWPATPRGDPALRARDRPAARA